MFSWVILLFHRSTEKEALPHWAEQANTVAIKRTDRNKIFGLIFI
jgi:hypothetical protein